MKTVHEGAIAEILSVPDQLRRSVLSCLLWDNTFYESGESIENRISRLANECDPKVVSYLAIEARSKYKLRSVPLVLANELAKKGGHIVGQTLGNIIQRPDEITKFMSMYWKNGKTPISKQVKKGLATAFTKFNEYQLAKWNREGAINLRDIMFLVHPKPVTADMANTWKRLADKELITPDTWEVGLSAAKTPEDKKNIWERLLSERKLGGLALLKNLRNMTTVGVDRQLIINALRNINVERILPYRFVTATKFAKTYEEYLEGAMYRCLDGRERIKGKTVLLVDVSGSMDDIIGKRLPWHTPIDSNATTRLDTAIGLAILLKFLCEDISIYTFSQNTVKIGNDFSGFNLGNKISKSQIHGGTYFGRSVSEVLRQEKKFDRIIAITDEQSHDNIDVSIPGKGYIMNVAPYEHGIDHDASWTRITGFSESVIDWMIENERPSDNWLSKLDEMFEINWSEMK